MKKFLLITAAVVCVIVMALILGRNILARTIIVNGIKQACGLQVDIAKVDIGLPHVAVMGLKVYNPAGFKDRVMAVVPEISMDVDPQGFFKNKVYIKQITLNVQEMNVVVNEEGKLNVNSFGLLAPEQGGSKGESGKKGGKAPEVAIDALTIKIGKVTYKSDYAGSGIKTMEFNAKIDETFHDVTDPAKVSGEIMQRIVTKIGIGSLATFDAKGGVKKMLDDAAQGFKNLFK